VGVVRFRLTPEVPAGSLFALSIYSQFTKKTIWSKNMSKKLDKILVVDVEATCWEGANPRGQPNEIIEIGICVVETATGARVAKESIIVKPQLSRVSAFCTQLTTLTQAEVDRGMSLKEACEVLRDKYLSPQYTWASYGDYDRRQFERECQDKRIGYPFGPAHLNVKNGLALLHSWDREVGMETALERLKLPLEGTHHRGGDDAWNIANLLGWVLRRCRRK
jgi:inhibitor of KinA sporulation pathway (predicted exonuclease)